MSRAIVTIVMLAVLQAALFGVYFLVEGRRRSKGQSRAGQGANEAKPAPPDPATAVRYTLINTANATANTQRKRIRRQLMLNTTTTTTITTTFSESVANLFDLITNSNNGVSKRQLRNTMRAAYKVFATEHKIWVESLFDMHFLTQHGEPIVAGYINGLLTRAQAAADLAWAWETARFSSSILFAFSNSSHRLLKASGRSGFTFRAAR